MAPPVAAATPRAAHKTGHSTVPAGMSSAATGTTTSMATVVASATARCRREIDLATLPGGVAIS
jgi:hypothetical protein